MNQRKVSRKNEVSDEQKDSEWQDETLEKRMHDCQCPITHEMMRDPVMLLDDGHSYEREAIERYIRESPSPVSPVTGKRLVFKIIQSNLTLKKIIGDFVRKNPLLAVSLSYPDFELQGARQLAVNRDACMAAELAREQNEIEQAKLCRQSPLIAYQKNLKAYLQQRELLNQHTGDYNYDVFISYAWENKCHPESHDKLQSFLKRIHNDLQAIGLKVFLDVYDIKRDMREAMITSIEQSGTLLLICKPFLKEAISQKPEGNVALEMQCILDRARQDASVFLPLLCEGEEESALPTPMQDQLSPAMIHALIQDIRPVFLEFDPEKPFSEGYLLWFTHQLVPRVVAPLGIHPEDDLLFKTLTQLFYNQVKQQQVPHLSQLLPKQQFQHNQPGVTEKEYHHQCLQALEFFLRRLQELSTYRPGVAAVQSVLLVYQREPALDSPACQMLDQWIKQFDRHLNLAGIEVKPWSEGPLLQPLPPAVILICTPYFKKVMDEGLQQPGSVWRQLQHHLTQPSVICCPLVYEGTYATAVPAWSQKYPQWEKSLFVRNTHGHPLKMEPLDRQYVDMMVKSDQSKGLLLDLLDYEDNDACYFWLLQNLQHMLFGWGTKDLLELEQCLLQRRQSLWVEKEEKEDPSRLPLPPLAEAFSPRELFSAKQNEPSLSQFLTYVVRGAEDSVEEMLIHCPALALAQDRVDDLSAWRCLAEHDEYERTFPLLSGLEYVVWAGDVHLLKKMCRYLEKDRVLLEKAIAQYHGVLQQGILVDSIPPITPIERGREWFRFMRSETKVTKLTHVQRSPHWDEGPLIEAMRTFLEHYRTWTYSKCLMHLRDEVGKQQRRLPVHVIQEMCRPDRACYPLKKNAFLELTLPRESTLDENQPLLDVTWWFQRSGTEAGRAVYRSAGGKPKSVTETVRWEGLEGDVSQQFWLKQVAHFLSHDIRALESLCTVRRQQMVEWGTALLQQLEALSGARAGMR